MSETNEATFRAFSEKDGSNYAQHRTDYHPKLYNAVVDYHKSTGGGFETLLDVGCGPGIAVRGLASHFKHAIGIDASRGMIESALALPNPPITKSNTPIRFDVSPAESLGADISPPIPDGSVDLLTAATAAHWFPMTQFWMRAAQVVKPGGTVALWCGGHPSVSPATPNYERVQAAINRLQGLVAEYLTEGNRIARNNYVDLPLPWTVDPPVAEFDKKSFVRKDWGVGEGKEPGEEFSNINEATLDMIELMMGTGSPVIRWREANKEKVGTEEDVVKIVRREMEEAFADAGVEKGKELLKGGAEGVLLLVKRM